MATWEAQIKPTHTTASMSASSGTVLAANTNRRYALIINDGTVDVYIKLGATAVANQGIRLNANGGFYELGPSTGNLFHGAINGITASGTSTVLVTEGV